MTGIVSEGMSGPARRGFAITPNDATNLTTETRGLYVGTAGNLVAILSGDSAAVTFTALSTGYHPLRIKRVLATGTTATALIGLT